MSDLFYNAVPNATRVAPPLPQPREYPQHKPAKVYLFGTCVVDLFYPEAGMDAIRLLEREGIRVEYPQGQSCCGQPAYTSGYTEQARKWPGHNWRCLPAIIRWSSRRARVRA